MTRSVRPLAPPSSLLCSALVVTRADRSLLFHVRFDGVAVEEALRLRKLHASSTTGSKVDKITVVTIGGAKCAETLRTGLAMGAVRTHPLILHGNGGQLVRGLCRRARPVGGRRDGVLSSDDSLLAPQLSPYARPVPPAWLFTGSHEDRTLTWNQSLSSFALFLSG